VNSTVSSGPPLHAIYPGVFDRTGGWRIRIWAQFGLCFGILGKWGLERGWIGGFPDRKKRVFERDAERLRTIGNEIFPAENFFENLVKCSGQDFIDYQHMGSLCH
jgi:hypothetical protein